MLKKIGHIIITIILLTTTTGYTLISHYCGEDLISNSIIADQSECCNESSSCCHNEEQSFQLEEDFFSIFYKYDFGQFPIFIPVLYGFSEYPILQTFGPVTLIKNPPPLYNHNSLSFIQVYIL